MDTDRDRAGQQRVDGDGGRAVPLEGVVRDGAGTGEGSVEKLRIVDNDLRRGRGSADTPSHSSLGKRPADVRRLEREIDALEIRLTEKKIALCNLRLTILRGEQ